jgi:hypothetical protein
MAENKLVLDMLAERFMQGDCDRSLFGLECLLLQVVLGHASCKRIPLAFFARRFLFPERDVLHPMRLSNIFTQTTWHWVQVVPLCSSNIFYLLGEGSRRC